MSRLKDLKVCELRNAHYDRETTLICLCNKNEKVISSAIRTVQCIIHPGTLVRNTCVRRNVKQNQTCARPVVFALRVACRGQECNRIDCAPAAREGYRVRSPESVVACL